MINDVQLSILENLCNLNFSVFSVGVTLLTVLMSFIISKKDELKVYNSLYKHNDREVTLKGKITGARSYIFMLRRFTMHVIIIIFSSILTYSVYWLKMITEPTIHMYYTVVTLSIGTILYIVFLLVCVTVFFLRDTKV